MRQKQRWRIPYSKKLPTCMTFGNNVVGYQLSYFCVNAGLACENLYYVYAYLSNHHIRYRTHAVSTLCFTLFAFEMRFYILTFEFSLLMKNRNPPVNHTPTSKTNDRTIFRLMLIFYHSTMSTTYDFQKCYLILAVVIWPTC